MRVLTASLVGNPLPGLIKVTVFMDGLRVGPARTQLFRLQASTMEEAIQIALQEEYSHKQARTPATVWQSNPTSGGAPTGSSGNGATNGPVPMDLGMAEQSDIRCYGCGKLGHMKRACPAGGLKKKFSSKPFGSRGRWQKPRPRNQGNAGHQLGRGTLRLHEGRAGGARHGDLAPENLCTLEAEKGSGGLLVVHASVPGYNHPLRILIDSRASKNFARRQTVACNRGKYADALRGSKGNGPVSVRLADGTVVEVPRVHMDLAVKFEDFDSTEPFLVLDMDKNDLILGIPWLEKHEPWIDWRGKAIGASRPPRSDRALVSHVPTSGSSWGAREGRQGASASNEFLGVVETDDDFGRAGQGLRVEMPDSIYQVGNLGPHAGNEVPQAARVAEEGAVSAGVGNQVPREVTQTITDEEGTAGASDVGNIVPQEVTQTITDAVVAEGAPGVGNQVPHGEVGNIVPPHKAGNQVPPKNKAGNIVPLKNRAGNVVPHGIKKISGATGRRRSCRKPGLVAWATTPVASDSEPPTKAPAAEECYHIFDGVTGRRVKAGTVELTALPEVSELLNLEELAMEDFLAELKAGEIAELVLLRPESMSTELNSSSVMDKEVLEEFQRQRASRMGSEIIKNPRDPVYPLVKEFEDVVSKNPPSQLPPDRGIRHEIDLVPGTKYCVTRQWPLPREQCEVIDAFFAAKAKAGMVRESTSPHSTPTFCVRKPNGKWRLVNAYNKLNSATVSAQTPIPSKDVLLNNMAGCTLYSALDLVDGYYQILMRESDIPLTAVSTPSGMLWEWLVMPQGLSNAPATFNRFVTQLFRPMRAFAQTYFDDIFVHSRAEAGQTAMDVHLQHLRRVFEVMRANKLYANIDKCVFAAEEIKVLGCIVSSAGVRADPEKVKAGRHLSRRRTYDSGWALPTTCTSTVLATPG
ncbi:hypothetical protein PF002_g23607 [Phytophthora fragariae]|uniref:Reverse transcriptase domain-containing protein n=1 Tax=Phytophthora fragariae TaxID=53985 RepID=A0A6A3X0K5_9STRA|nr:hypothetical protein PF002_g23607 [Phytophthora fragariae]